jgi:hypothetical protein
MMRLLSVMGCRKTVSRLFRWFEAAGLALRSCLTPIKDGMAEPAIRTLSFGSHGTGYLAN